MTRKSLTITDKIYRYLLDNSLREPEILRELRDLTASHKMAMMQIAPEQGQFISMLVQILQAKKIIEIGVFTGYSTLCMALSMPDDGHIVACDINEEYTDIAREFWVKAGVQSKIDLQLAPALETLDKLINADQEGQFDFVFIDADKTEYQEYYERALKLLRKGGVIMVDNTLWYGKPADPAQNDKDTRAIREFNRNMYKDKRVSISLLPVADGITLVLKLQ